MNPRKRSWNVAQAVLWVRDYRGPLTSAEHHALLSLAARVDEHFECFPGVKKLALDCRLHRQTVLSAIAGLQGKGLIRDTGERRGTTRSVRVFELMVGDLEAYLSDVPATPKRSNHWTASKSEAVEPFTPSSTKPDPEGSTREGVTAITGDLRYSPVSEIETGRTRAPPSSNEEWATEEDREVLGLG